MTDTLAAELTALALVVLLLAYLLVDHETDEPDAGVDILDDDITEDITRPSLEVIDDALRHVGADNRGAQDWLLDRRLAAMERASNGA